MEINELGPIARNPMLNRKLMRLVDAPILVAST